MRKALVALLAVAIALTITDLAGARTYRWTDCTAKLPANRELACGRRLVRHATDLRRFLQSEPTAGTFVSRIRLDRARAFLALVGRRRIAEARGRLEPPIAHWRLWACIHNGRYAGGPHEGWSRGGTYAGPLQMTHPWHGFYDDWGAMRFRDVYARAEQAYRDEGYSRAWLEHQWPNTAPPCLDFS